MPYVYYDDDKRRHYMFRKVPKDVQSILGKSPFTHKFKQSVDEASANAFSIEINFDWERKITDARTQLGRPAPTPWMDLAYVERLQQMADDARRVYAAMQASGEPILSYAELKAAGKELAAATMGVTFEEPPQTEGSQTEPSMKLAACTTEDTIELWRDDRGDDQPDQDSINGRRNKMRDFFAWVREKRHPVVGGDDLTQCTGDDVQGYKDFLVKTHGRESNVPRDRMIDVLACFNYADKNNRFRGLKGGNPAEKVVTPKKRTGAPRPAFTDLQADHIMQKASAHPDALIYWGVPLQRYHGAIISEFADAKARHVKLVNGIWCIEFTPEGRTTIVEGKVQAKGLKTKARHRGLPLHPWFLRNGFIERRQHLLDRYGPDAPLFPEVRVNNRGERRTKASDVMVGFLRGIGIENQIDPKTGKLVAMLDSYNWRHWLATKLQTVAATTTAERRRYMTGHAGVDVHENIYVEHPPAELKPFIDALPDFFPKSRGASVVAEAAAE